VIEHACFFLSQHNNASGTISKPFKHCSNLSYSM
jgi:hypothetical protein